MVLVLINNSSNRKIGVNFSDKDALLNFQFHLINLSFSKIGIYRDNLIIANIKEAKNTSISTANAEKMKEPGTK